MACVVILSQMIMLSIYIVDFDEDIMAVLCKWFEIHGYAVKCFSNHEQLLEQLYISHPDCIILDCLYGKACLTSNICQIIQQQYHYSGKMILTSTSNLSNANVKDCNATHFITKPFDLPELLWIVNRIVGGSLKRMVN